MAIVVEDGSGKTDAETYCSVAVADAYHDARANTFSTLTDAAKEAALREATAYIDGNYYRRFKGDKATNDQALRWPRLNVVDEGHEVASNEIPNALQYATAELALAASTGELNPDLKRGGRIKRAKAGDVEVEYESSASATTSYRQALFWLRPLLRAAGRISLA